MQVPQDKKRDTKAGIDFLMGKNQDKAIARASELQQIKKQQAEQNESYDKMSKALGGLLSKFGMTEEQAIELREQALKKKK